MAELRELHMEKAKFIVNFDELSFFLMPTGKTRLFFLYFHECGRAAKIIT